MKFAYVGICSSAFDKGIFICNLLKISMKRENCLSLFAHEDKEDLHEESTWKPPDF